MTNKWKLATVILGAVLFICACCYAYATPYIAMRNMRTAFVEKDAKRFCGYIDFPVFKENFKAELNAKMMAEMSKSKELEDNPFAGLGMMMGPAIVNNMIDAFVSPAAIERMMLMSEQQQYSANNNGTFPNLNPFQTGFGNPDSEKVEVTTGYESLNEFVVETNSKTNPLEGARIVFERRGLFSWQLVNIKLK